MEAMFEVGDKAYYPVHGVAEVVAVERRDIGGAATEVYVLRVVDTGLKILVPKTNVESVGLRAIMSEKDVREVFSILTSAEATLDTQTWNRRYREYMEKIKTGSAFEIAEVLRDLYHLRTSKELSFGERRMLETARGLLVKEIALAKDTSEGDIEREIDALFPAAA